METDKKITIEDVEKAWAEFDRLKEYAEQHMFVDILFWDIRLKPYYKDLKENWNEEHARIFMKGMKVMFEHFGIKEDLK